jgi:hypothetical protein
MNIESLWGRGSMGHTRPKARTPLTHVMHVSTFFQFEKVFAHAGIDIVM